MATGKDAVIQAAQNCDESGYERDDGRWVDPLPVQKVAIEESFRAAAQDEFDVWSVVNWQAHAQEGDTIAENFERVVEAWDETVDNPELRERLEQLAEGKEQDVPE